MKPKAILLHGVVLIALFANTDLYAQGTGLVDMRKAPQVITVGGPGADIPGYTSGAIRLAVDALVTRGGGTVKLNPGIYQLDGPVCLASNITLTGSGEQTILRKSDGYKTSFVVDADWGMQKATVGDASGFKSGTGIMLSDDANTGCWDATMAVITDVEGNVIYFDNRTIHDYIASQNGTVTNAFSPVQGVDVENVTISNLVIDGNKSTNAYITGCRGGGIYLFRAKNCLVENVVVKDFNGDSFSWQIDDNITVRGCTALNGNGLGYHPGTGSNHSLVENCTSHDNSGDGIFLCWRVQNGTFRNNIVYGNGGNGISIGHQDTDNVFENNHVYENAYQGVLFREETAANSGHRNIFTGNTIENNGMKEEANGFYIGGETHDIIIRNNIIRSNGKGNQKTAIRIGRSSQVTAEENTIAGSKDIVKE
jgi:parallel beta-helix repeat protein